MGILLDMCFSRMMVRRELVPEAKTWVGEAVAVWCAHGDMILYPLAGVEMEVEGLQVKVQTAVCNKLPVTVLLGTDDPELSQIVQSNPRIVHTEGIEKVIVVTRAHKAKEEIEELQQLEKDEQSGVHPNLVEERSTVVAGEEREPDVVQGQEEGAEVVIGAQFDKAIFQEGREVRPKTTRSQRRKERQRNGLVRAKDRRRSEGRRLEHVLDFGRVELCRLQESDETLATVRDMCTKLSGAERQVWHKIKIS